MILYASGAAWRASLFAAVAVCATCQLASAQTVPSPWEETDIGAPALGGRASYDSGIFSIEAGGSGIWDSSDQFYFVYQKISGDAEITARLDSLEYADMRTSAGVMIRSVLTPDAAHGYTSMTPSGNTSVRWRSEVGARTTYASGSGAEGPVWLRIVRKGSILTGFSSFDGTNWTTIGSSSVALGSTAYAGLVVASRKATALTTAVLSNVSVQSGSSGLPSGQENKDVGSPAIAGRTTYSSGTYTISAGGADIWGTSDQFHYVYQPITGNAEVVARVRSLTDTDPWAKAGVMIRESITAQSRHAMAIVTPGRGYAFQRRPETGGTSVHTSGGAGVPPGWVKLVRAGDLFTAYRSADGVSWQLIGSDTILMGETVYVGLAATSHNTAAATTAVIDSVTISAAVSTNKPPAVSITAPASGTTVNAPASVTISATASDPENRMLSVDFYLDSTLLVRDTSAPYSTTWSATTAGTFSLTAVAHDADGGSTRSGAVSVTVNGSTNLLPTVTLSTGGILSFTAPATITLTATASDPEGQLARVEFFNGTTRLASDTSAPYGYSWSNVAAGTYSLTAVAYDAAGASTRSAAVSVTVVSATTAPKGVVFTASADHATNVNYYVLKVFTAGATTATATPVATSDLGKPTPNSNGDISVDRSAFFSALAVGNYVATVTAVGSGGQTQSGSVAFTR